MFGRGEHEFIENQKKQQNGILFSNQFAVIDLYLYFTLFVCYFNILLYLNNFYTIDF